MKLGISSRLGQIGWALWGVACGVGCAAEFHVSPQGDDAGPGSAIRPFASLQRAEKAASPGDTVWIAGGTYRMTEEQIARKARGRAMVVFLTKSGQPGKPIRYMAEGKDPPVFDFSAIKLRDARVTGFHVAGSWLQLKGFSVTGVQVGMTGHTQSICVDNEGDHNVYENLQMHDGQAIGFWLGKGRENLVLNCDAFRNHDFTSENGRGGNVDGFGFHVPKGSTGNVFRGCRAWFNSDDGFDLINTAEAVLIENCWSFYNGFSPDFKSLADGNGFKLGGFGVSGGTYPTPVPRHVVKRCLAVRNKASGFYANHHPGGIDLIHNTAYLNSYNFNLLGRNAEHTADVPGYGHTLLNNLGYKGRTELTNLNAAACRVEANSFDRKLVFRDRDFEGLDLSDLVKPRLPSGELPVVPLLHLKAGNPAIDQGASTGERFKGRAPDMGAFESGR